MEKAPTTDKSLGIMHGCDYEGFAGVRQRAKSEWEDRHIKGKRNKQDPVPEFRVDQEIVVTKGYFKNDKREYVLIKIVDFEEESGSFRYYGVVLKVTNKDLLKRLGRLICTGQRWFGYYSANVSPEKIRWLEEK